jgi:hypothetical protein
MIKYLKELNQKFGYRPTWEPGKPLLLGDVGVLEKGVFSHRTTLDSLDIPIKIRKANTGSDIQYISEGGVDIQKKLSGEVPVAEMALSELDAGFSISFSKQHAILFAAKNARTSILSNMHDIEKEIFKLMENDEWKKEWVFISELMQTDGATILISVDQSSKFELKANADVSAGDLHIADATLDFQTSVDKNMQFKIVAQKGVNPLYRASGVKKNWFSSGKLATKGLDEQEPPKDFIEQIPLSDSEFE